VVVTGHAGKWIATRCATVEVWRTGIASHPPNWVTIDRTGPCCTYAARNVAAIAAFRVVAAQTSGGPRTSFDRMSHQEVAHVLELPFDAIRLALFHEEPPALLVAVGTPSLRVTRLTDIRVSRGRDPVALLPRSVVTQESLRQQPREFRPNVARCAVSAFEIALVTFEAFAHGRRAHGSLFAIDDSCVTRDTLTMDRTEWQMFVVGENDTFHAFGLCTREAQGTIHQRNPILVTAIASLDPRWCFVGGRRDLAVASRTAQALRLTGSATLYIEVFQVLKAHNGAFATRREPNRDCHQHGDQSAYLSRVHGSPPRAAP
jgi:hypothetical protein